MKFNLVQCDKYGTMKRSKKVYNYVANTLEEAEQVIRKELGRRSKYEMVRVELSEEKNKIEVFMANGTLKVYNRI